MAQSIGQNKPNSYRLISVVISNNEGSQIDVSNLVDSFSITESIYQMFLTGSITIADNINVFNRLNITGQEYIRIHFSGILGFQQIKKICSKRFNTWKNDLSLFVNIIPFVI